MTEIILWLVYCCSSVDVQRKRHSADRIYRHRPTCR